MPSSRFGSEALKGPDDEVGPLSWVVGQAGAVSTSLAALAIDAATAISAGPTAGTSAPARLNAPPGRGLGRTPGQVARGDRTRPELESPASRTRIAHDLQTVGQTNAAQRDGAEHHLHR